VRKGNDSGSLGPSDSSDSGSDVAGGTSAGDMASDSDAAGTGKRPGVAGSDKAGVDIGVDRTVDPQGAGLGTGLGEAEQAPRGSSRAKKIITTKTGEHPA